MFIDYHTHHNRCGHAVGSIEDYIMRGMEIGLHQLGVSDHMPLFHVTPSTLYSGLAMDREELPRYVEEVLRLKEKYRDDMVILLGIEADYVEGFEEEIVRLLADHPWDYVIGSVHFLGDWDLFDNRRTGRWKEMNLLSVYEAYYRAVEKAAESRLFDIIGHMDGIKRFAPGSAPAEEWELQLQALNAIDRCGTALELNTSGLRHNSAGIFPSMRILQECGKRSIPVTVGSDAHHPRHVAAGFDEAAALAGQAGLRAWAVFSERRRSAVPVTRYLATV